MGKAIVYSLPGYPTGQWFPSLILHQQISSPLWLGRKQHVIGDVFQGLCLDGAFHSHRPGVGVGVGEGGWVGGSLGNLFSNAGMSDNQCTID